MYNTTLISSALLTLALLLPHPATAQTGTSAIKLEANASLNGNRVMPEDSPWNADISAAPVDDHSDRILKRIGLDTPLHPDFGTAWEGAPIGIPYVVVGRDQPKVPITFTYADESDPGPYPIPMDAPIEGGPHGDGDRHVLVLDRDTWKLWEVFNAHPGDTGWTADSGAVWDLRSNQERPAGWTSADAAGLPILPGLVRYDEIVEQKSLNHALRFTVAKTRKAYVPPASHWASDLTDEDLAPMGMRVRLKGGYNISGFAPEVQVILQGLKTYGMIMADNGSDLFISGAPDPRWNDDALHELSRITARDLEVIEMKGLVVGEQ
jgi:hypothetical protein